MLCTFRPLDFLLLEELEPEVALLPRLEELLLPEMPPPRWVEVLGRRVVPVSEPLRSWPMSKVELLLLPRLPTTLPESVPPLLRPTEPLFSLRVPLPRSLLPEGVPVGRPFTTVVPGRTEELPGRVTVAPPRPPLPVAIWVAPRELSLPPRRSL